MQFQLIDQPEFAAVRAILDPGESLVTESGAMLGMGPGLTLQTNMTGGLLAAAKRKALGGESIFLNTYTAGPEPARLDFAPAMPGDIRHRKMQGEQLFLQSGAFLASSTGVSFTTQWGGAKGFFGGAGLFLLRITGTGDLFFSSYGAIREVDVKGSYIVDTGHIVAFEETLNFEVKTSGGMKNLFFSGEGLICEFNGHGKLWLQTRGPQALAAFLHPFRRVQKSN